MQDVTDRFLEDYVMYAYPRLIRKYLDDKIHIPQDRLIEIQYERLAEDPLGTLRDIYTKLNLSDFDSALPQVSQYLDSVRSYQKNIFNLTDDQIYKINSECEFIFREFGYQMRPP